MRSARHANDRRLADVSVTTVLAVMAVAGILIAATRLLLVDVYIIPSASMEPTFRVGDRAWVNQLGSPERGDVVVFADPGGWSGLFTSKDDRVIKRVIGVGGDTVVCSGSKLLVNGQVSVESYVKGRQCSKDFTVTVPEGELWMMGDNRDNSSDSRAHGPVSESAVIGPVFWGGQ